METYISVLQPSILKYVSSRCTELAQILTLYSSCSYCISVHAQMINTKAKWKLVNKRCNRWFQSLSSYLHIHAEMFHIHEVLQ